MQHLVNNGIFVIHALKGYELHEKRIKALFNENKLKFEFVTDGDLSIITPEIIKKYFTKNIESKLSMGVLSCTLNHIYAYERIVSRNIPFAIIFENDPFFLGDFVGNLDKYLPEIKTLKPGFIVSLENSTLKFPSIWQTKKATNIYQAKAGRMAGAYLIDLEGAKNILKQIEKYKCNEVIDWYHNLLINKDVLKMYWVHPPMVEQGSHNGFLNSTISSKPNTWLRRASWLLQKSYKCTIKRLFNEKNIV